MRDNPYRKLDDEFDHAAEALTWDEGYEAALDDVRAFVHDGEGADVSATPQCRAAGRMKNHRTCRTCLKAFQDPGAGKRDAPAGFCSRKCADSAARERANRKASMRTVPPRAPLRLLSPSSRDWSEPHAKRDAEGVCRVCGREGVDAAHIVPRSICSTGGEQQDNIVPLCRSCHRLYDEGFLSLEEYLTAAEAACAVLLSGSLRAALRLVSGGRESAA